ncbi:MAG TPA: hypothetical protein VL282_18140 [Tepidisphaeraceae bacterium]|jgi:uncharacterized protein YbaR (Trm112 family)|nr:hypothetical protein [Tepidisphaeraceae bacterium]
MSWTAEQLETLYSHIYANRSICPACNGPLIVSRSKDPTQFGIITCRACRSEHLISRENDPLREAFRPYTEAEKKKIIAADKHREDPICPIDRAMMIVYAQRSLGLNSQVRIRCPRCGGEVTFKRLYG